jgi:hypothetical protein
MPAMLLMVIWWKGKNGEAKFQQKFDPKINKWLRNSGFNRYLMEAAKDIVWFYHAFPELVMGDDGTVRGIAVHAAEDCRFEYRNKTTGTLDWVLVNKNRAEGANYRPELTKKVAAVDPYFGAVEKIKADKRGKNFVFPLFMPVPGCDYYQIPEWYSVFESGWFDFAESIPLFKKELMKNQLSIKYIIRIQEWYWKWKYSDWDENLKMREKYISDTLDDITERLSNVEGAGKSILVTDKMNTGEDKELKGIQVEAVDDKLKDGTYIEDGKMANEHILYALNLDHQLAGSPPGGGMGAGSGSNIRVALNKHIAFNKPYQDLLLEPLYIISDINGWNVDEWRFNNPSITKLDEGKEVQQEAS